MPTKDRHAPDDAVREAVDEFFLDAGTLLTLQIDKPNAKLADLFRETRNSDAPPDGRAYARDAARKLVNRLTGGTPPLWIALLLTGRLTAGHGEEDLKRIASRFIYLDCRKPDSDDESAGKLWDDLIDDVSELKSHFENRLSLSLLYSRGLLTPEVRQVHLLNVDHLATNKPEFSHSAKVGVWGKHVPVSSSGMTHGLPEDDCEKLRRYLEFLARDTRLALYTSVPIVSEHNVLERSIGEIFIAEGSPVLPDRVRRTLINGLRHVALGLTAKFIEIDQKQLADKSDRLGAVLTQLREENRRVRVFEEQMKQVHLPLLRISKRLFELRSDARRVDLALYKPRDLLFGQYQEVSDLFDSRVHELQPEEPGRLAIRIEHDVSNYSEKEAETVLAVVLARILGFEDILADCTCRDRIVAKAHDVLTNCPPMMCRMLSYIREEVLGGKAVDKLFTTPKTSLELLKHVLHTAHKVDAFSWPLLPFLLACDSDGDTAFSYSFHGAKTTVSTARAELVEKKIERVGVMSPYGLRHLLEFLISLRDLNGGIGSISFHDSPASERIPRLWAAIELQVPGIERVVSIRNALREPTNAHSLESEGTHGSETRPFHNLMSLSSRERDRDFESLSRAFEACTDALSMDANTLLFALRGTPDCQEDRFACALCKGEDNLPTKVGLYWFKDQN